MHQHRTSKHSRFHASNLLDVRRKSGLPELNDRTDSLPDEVSIESSEWLRQQHLPELGL
jgi:hypothetical protein